MPDYDEISMKYLWPIHRQNEDFKRCFPDYTEKQLPSPEFFWNVNFILFFSIFLISKIFFSIENKEPQYIQKNICFFFL